MDRIWASTDGTGELARRSPSEDFALPSRGEAIVALRPALESQAGPVLVTGEAGVGKTWLWRRLQAEMPLAWRWVVVDVPPAIDPTVLYHLIGHGLGLPAAGVADEARLALADFLGEATADGARWALVLDEAHNASATVLEEVRILANRLGRPDGLSALILVGQTSLACRLSLRPLKALRARLSAHVHLRCLDVEEARALLNCLSPTVDWDERTLERRHRDAGGNPRRMLLAAREEATSALARRPRERGRPPVEAPSSPPLDLERSKLPPGSQASSNTPDEWETPVVGPFKPPLRVGEGMIEVGWEPGLEPESETTTGMPLRPALEPKPAPAPVSAPVRVVEHQVESEVEPEQEVEVADESVETIDDHYAALQAWNEWARNQGRGAVAATPVGVPARNDPGAVANTEGDPLGGSTQGTAGPPSVWIESQQGFAPYGQLFSRLRQIRDVNEST